MAISEEEVLRLHKANKPSTQVHLRAETTKLIVYSYVESKLQVQLCERYKNNNKLDYVTEDWKIERGLNVICLCRCAAWDEWPTTYRRISVTIKCPGQSMFLGHAPDLDRRWQIVIVTENLLFSLQDRLAMKLGIQFMRQEEAVAHAREQDGIDHILTTNRKLLDSWKLSASQKVLLRWNASLTRNRSCPLLTKGTNGHDGVSLSSDVQFFRVFDVEFTMRYAWAKRWFKNRWRAIMDDPYWKSRDTFVPFFDLHDRCVGSYSYFE